jgi:spore germination cell wall hydrolase CwlJ-like protein
LIGEAVGEGYTGMYAVACCVRNRLDSGMSHGISAMKRKDLDTFVNKQGSKYKEMVVQIIEEVFNKMKPDITNGATHFESVRYKTPYWAKDKAIVYRYKNHIFYK